MEQKRRTSVTSESSLEAIDSVRTSSKPKKEAMVMDSTPSTSENNDSDNFESETDYSSTRRTSTSSLQETRRSHMICGRKFRSSTPINEYEKNHQKNNSSGYSIKDASNSSHVLTVQKEKTQNESGFVDMSSHHLNSSPELGSTERDDVKYICPICEVVSATPHEFTNHIRCHNYSSGDTENFTCRICFKVLSSASSLDRHVLVHTGERPFNCKYCHLTFTTNGNMHRHMRTHKQHVQQRNINIVSGGDGATNKSNAPADSRSSGSRNGDGESDESDGCSSDSSISNLNNNRTTCLINNNNLFKRKNSEEENSVLKRRIKTINNNNIYSEIEFECIDPSTQKYSCPLCNRADFLNMFTLGIHMDREHPGIPAKCRQCEMVFKSHKSLNAHRCVQETNITQGFKDLTFVDFTSEKFPLIAKSLCEQSVRTPITKQKFECPKCYRAFPCTSAVEIHAKDCGDSPHDYSLRKRTCSESSEDESRRDEFFAHLDLRNKSAMSLASTMSSPRTSEKSDTLAKSYLERTPQSAIYTCNESKDLADIQSILNVTSTSNSFLRNFENAVNTPPTSDFNLGKDEEEAQDAFTSEFRKMKLRGEFPCKLCSAVFPNLRALKGHNRVHLSAAGAGPYCCNMCPYSIHDKAALIRHMRTHNGDRPYECAVCNYAFTTKANCERHLRNRHAKTTREEVKRAIIYHPSEDSSCEDQQKKVQMFSSPELDDEEHSSPPKDRSTPVSHLKEMLQSINPAKIQVKSLEKLMGSSCTSKEACTDNAQGCTGSSVHMECTRPIDLTMDVLDLSKKTKSKQASNEEKPEAKPPSFPALDKSHNWFLAQQQLLKDSVSQIDPAHYIQLSQLYRNLMFPTIPPFLFPNSFLPNSFGDINKFPSMLLNPMFPPISNGTEEVANRHAQSVDSLMKSPENHQPNSPASTQLLPPSPQQLNIPRHPLASTQPPANMMPQIQNVGPVKMVIKNGVLMPKQKQRRYRTERPFTCEHCAARFTLRSNMERHVKQQHPQFWAQRQRSGHHILRRSGTVMQQINSTSVSPQNCGPPQNQFSAISDHVKYAILAQQLKARKDTDILQKALTQNKNVEGSHLNLMSNVIANAGGNIGLEDDDPKLIIDEGNHENDENDEEDEVFDEPEVEDASKCSPNTSKCLSDGLTKPEAHMSQNDLKDLNEKCRNDPNCMDTSETTSEPDEPLGKYLKNSTNSSFKEESSDLVSVIKLVDNAKNSLSSFNNYFQPTNMPSHMDQSDEEGLVASGSTSESNNSGNEDPQSVYGGEGKRKSAYSLAPNRVSCNYCQRTFPWTSSLRRHILTHTGQKPFKCSHCPLLFTTKSNCDRHLLRKHGNIDSAVSLYVPIDDIPDPVPVPKVEEPAEETRKPFPSVANVTGMSSSNVKLLEPLIISSDLPFKCHLCDSSFAERNQCLEHIKLHHHQEFTLLLAKGAIDAETDYNQIHSTEDEERVGEGRGKYPDYANRKVMCAFCMRRFWSTEDLRRHMRTHSGERPFQCDVCLRKFTLKHSMLRHMKKHSNGQNHHQSSVTNSGSDMSEDEQPVSILHKNPLIQQKIREALTHAEVWRNSNLFGVKQESSLQQSLPCSTSEKESLGIGRGGTIEENSDLISDLLGIRGQGILNKLLSSAEEAAKLLGVDK